ncbi:MAG: alkaline phosphatase D family protein [Chitinophagales bacterium]|nr:alkaline phosphatase D family protein [Chitinophagales bacterium]
MKKILFVCCWLLGTWQLNAQWVAYSPVLGAATDTSVKIMFFTNAPTELTVQLSRQADFQQIDRQYSLSSDPKLYNRVLVDAAGLQPATTYHYRIMVNGQADARQGYFKTFPPAGTRQHYVIATGSCQETPNMKVFNVMADAKPDILIHTGDWSYPDYMIPGYPHDDSSVFRGYVKRYTEKEMEKMLPYTFTDYVGDNHDGVGASAHRHVKRAAYKKEGKKVINYMVTDSTQDSIRRRILKGYYDMYPHYPMVDTSRGCYHSFVMGNSEIFFLDTRADACFPPDAFKYDSTKNLWSFKPDSNHKIISDAQMDWLKQGLKNSTADWKFIVMGVPFNKNLIHLVNLGIHMQDLLVSAGGETGTGFRLALSWSFYWNGYPASQNELLGFIKQNNLKDIIVLSGDTHHNVMDDGRNAGLPEINASGLSVTGTVLAHYMNLIGRLAGYPKMKRYAWNGGGNGLGNKNYKNAYGRVDIYGNESAKLSLVDEDGQEISAIHLKHSSQPGYKPLPERKPHYIRRVERISFHKKPTFRLRFVKAMGRAFMNPEKKENKKQKKGKKGQIDLD